MSSLNSQLVNDDGKKFNVAKPDGQSSTEYLLNENTYGDIGPFKSLEDVTFCPLFSGERGTSTNGKNCYFMFPGI